MEVNDQLLPWEVVSARVQSDKELIFGRTKTTMDSYLAHKARISKEWKDISSYCKHRMLGYPYLTETVINESGEKESRKYVPNDADCCPTGERVKVMDNEFPYAFTPDILHKVIWSATELTIEEYRIHLNKHFSEDEYDILMFINPPQLKSVLGVHHGHAFVRKKWTEIGDIIVQESYTSGLEAHDKDALMTADSQQCRPIYKIACSS